MAVLNGYTVVLATDDYIPQLVKLVHADAKSINDVDVGGRAEASATSEKTRILLSSAGRLVRQAFKIIDPKKVYEETGVAVSVPSSAQIPIPLREDPEDKAKGGVEVKGQPKKKGGGSPKRTRLATNTITARGIRISFVEYSNQAEPSFSSEAEIYLNTNNDFVDKVLDAPKNLIPLFLVDPVAHELSHIMLGNRVHDDDFVKLNDYLRYNLFLGHLSDLTKIEARA
jgi:hypothetical protein